MIKNSSKSNSVSIIRLIIFFIITLLFFLLFAVSCDLLSPRTGEEGEESEEGESGDIEGKSEYGEGVSSQITLWDCSEPEEKIALIDSIEDFMAENNNIEIETRHFRNREEMEDQFEAASLAGAGPELMLVNLDSVQRLATGNVLKEITDNEDGFDYSLIIDGLVEISEYNGRKYIIPFRGFDFLMFFYNKDLLEEPPESFEEVVEYCREVNNFGQQTYGFLLNSSEPDWIIPFIGGYSDWIVDYSSTSLTLATDATEKAMEFLIYIYNEEKILPASMEYSEISDLFKSGNVHMIMDDLNAVEEYREAGLNLGVSKIPRVLGGNKYPTPLISGFGFMININCYGIELEAVNEFIDYMMTEEVQVDWNLNTHTIPVLKSIDSNIAMRDDDILYNAFQQAKLCRGKPYERLIMVIRDAIRDNVENVISGDLVPADAAILMQEDALRLRSGEILLEEPEDEGGDEGP
jgi:arabinogalactan oligomer/maltooligosaccharide transport system substrate-binding protein